jgi:uncharacterized membrane protein YedE/YeeE
MPQLLPDRIPWFIAGPLLGLIVVGFYAVLNRRLGVTTAYGSVAYLVVDRARSEGWRVWYFVGLAAGALFATLLQGGPRLQVGFGALGAALPLALLIPLLFGAGMLIGYGARWSGGCTSGHGISGNSSLSVASLAATLIFMATAIGVTWLLHLVTGGAL